MKQSGVKILLIVVLSIGAFFRFYNLNWDQDQHLHPDERFLTMVGNAMKLPSTISMYFDQETSLLNPENIGYSFFVYGVFPLTLNKILAVWFATDTYPAYTIQGRFLAGFFDLLIVLLIYKTVALLEKEYAFSKMIKVYASFFYAIAVLPIQLSHFFAVDPFVNFFSFATCYFLLRYTYKRSFFSLSVAAVCFAAALACKITVLFLLPLYSIAFLYKSPLWNSFLQVWHGQTLSYALSTLLRTAAITAGVAVYFFIVTYLFLRMANPYMFEEQSLLQPQISNVFLSNIQMLKSFEGDDVWYPPAVQWMTKKPILFSLENMVVFGVGFVWFAFFVIGCVGLLLHKKRGLFVVIFVWLCVFFLYQSIQFVKALRYFLFLYPFMAIFAGYGFYWVTKKQHSIVHIGCIVLVLLWPLSFFSIYVKPNTRISASEWIYTHLKETDLVLNEHWDDPLPLLLPTQKKQIYGEQLPVFDPDTQEKWEKMQTLLEEGEYIIFSSNRGWGSIPTVPDRYPQMSKFYEDLFAGRLPFQKVAEFTSYPSLFYLGIPVEFPDDWADETFTVYDHPKVMIFQKIR